MMYLKMMMVCLAMVCFLGGCAGASTGAVQNPTLPAENCSEELTNGELGTCLDSCTNNQSGDAQSIDCRTFCCEGEIRPDSLVNGPV
jgi:hypothetical protein